MIKILNVSINANVLFVKFIECFMYNLGGIFCRVGIVRWDKMRENREENPLLLIAVAFSFGKQGGFII